MQLLIQTPKCDQEDAGSLKTTRQAMQSVRNAGSEAKNNDDAQFMQS